MATKAKAGSTKKTKKVSTKAAAQEKSLALAYDAQLLNDFVLGNITLGELEGIPKKTQYEIADRGFKLLNEGKLDEAEKIFRGLITLDPFDSYFHTVMGSIHQRRQMGDEAIEEYSRALKVNPYNATALANRGEIFFQQGRVLEATQDIQAALDADPDFVEPATARARILAMALAKTIEENKDEILKVMKASEGSLKAKKKTKKSTKKSAKKVTKKVAKKKTAKKK